MKFSKQISVICLLTLLFLSSCYKKKIEIASAPKFDQTFSSTRVENILQKNSNKIKSIKAMANIFISDSEQERQSEAAIVVMLPHYLRLDAIDRLADLWARAGTNGRALWLWLPHKNKFYKGAASKRNLKKLADFDFEIQEMLSILMGIVPNSNPLRLVEVDKKTKHYRLLKEPVHVFVDKKKRYPIKIIKYKNIENEKNPNEIQYTATFSNWQKIDHIYFPKKIDINFPAKSCRLIITYNDVSLNTDVDMKIFEPQKPGN